MTASRSEVTEKTGRMPSMFVSLLVVGVKITLILLLATFFGGDAAKGPLQVSL